MARHQEQAGGWPIIPPSTYRRAQGPMRGQRLAGWCLILGYLLPCLPSYHHTSLLPGKVFRDVSKGSLWLLCL